VSQPYKYQALIDMLEKGDFPSARELKSALVDLEVKLRTEVYVSGQLRDGLKYYAPGPFWTEVTKETKASQDLGKHADWILRLTDDGTYSPGA
jgi:hypothetical protein